MAARSAAIQKTLRPPLSPFLPPLDPLFPFVRASSAEIELGRGAESLIVDLQGEHGAGARRRRKQTADREDQGSSKSVHNSLQHTKEQEDIKGEATVATASEPMREELVQSAISFLKHPKVVASSDVQRRSFLENKGLSVDEIDEAFRLLLSPPSNSVNSDTCTPQGVSDHSCRTTGEAEIDTECVDVSETPNPETVTPVLPRHPISYMEVMEMIQRGERPDDIQDINDEPPNLDQPISEARMAPKPKPWEKQGQESPSWDLKAHPSDSSESRSEVHNDSTDKATGSNNSSNHGDLSLMVEPVTGSEAPADDAASPKQ